MRFGIFFEFQVPKPWQSGDEERVIREALAQTELADRLGIQFVWEVEHHFLEEYSHSSAPEIFLAAASQRTQRIRLGHGIVPILPGYNHPARVVERAAMLDILSGGRLEVGTGETTTNAELLGFGIDVQSKAAIWAEVIREIPKMFVQEPYAGHQGRAFAMPPRNVLPKPKQKPHPPLWVACSRREKVVDAARYGLGALHFAFTSPQEARAHVEAYHKAIELEAVPVGYFVNPNLAVTVGFHCHEREDVAIERGIDGVHFFAYSLLHYSAFGTHRPARTSVNREFAQGRDAMGFARRFVKAEGRNLADPSPTPEEAAYERAAGLSPGSLQGLRGAVGSVEQVRAYMRAYEEAGVDQVILVAQQGATKHEHICESLELFAREILPEFQDRHEQREAEKMRRLAPALEAAMRRRERDLPAPEHEIPPTRGAAPALNIEKPAVAR